MATSLEPLALASPPLEREVYHGLSFSWPRRLTIPPGWRWILVPLAVGLASRVVVLLVGYAALWLLPDNPQFIRANYGTPSTLQSWYAWDAAWYVAIAVRGYALVGPTAPSVAFWPLLPMIERVFADGPLAWLLPLSDRPERVAWAGIVIVSVAFLIALVVFYRLVLADYPADVARRAILFLAFSPGAVFYTAPYPSALLLAGVAGCLLALRHRRWALAGLAGAGAALAQVPGCLLVVPFAWTYLAHWRRPRWSLLWGLLIPLGPALWLAFLGWTLGDSLAPIHAAERFWHHTRAWPWVTLWNAVALGLSAPATHILVLFNVTVAIAAAVASGWALLRGPRAWGAWGLAVLALYLSVPAREPLEGMLRYALSILPMWLLAARLCRRPSLEGVAVGLLAAFLALATALFVNSYWVA